MQRWTAQYAQNDLQQDTGLNVSDQTIRKVSGLSSWCPLVGTVLTAWCHGARLAFAIEYQKYQGDRLHLVLFTDESRFLWSSYVACKSFSMTDLEMGQWCSVEAYPWRDSQCRVLVVQDNVRTGSSCRMKEFIPLTRPHGRLTEIQQNTSGTLYLCPSNSR